MHTAKCSDQACVGSSGLVTQVMGVGVYADTDVNVAMINSTISQCNISTTGRGASVNGASHTHGIHMLTRHL